MPLSHAQIWSALDRLAAREGLTPSSLARRADLDPTSFNPSKRMTDGRARWPSTESLTKVLSALGVSLGEFAALAEVSDGFAPRLYDLAGRQLTRDLRRLSRVGNRALDPALEIG